MTYSDLNLILLIVTLVVPSLAFKNADHELVFLSLFFLATFVGAFNLFVLHSYFYYLVHSKI